MLELQKLTSSPNKVIEVSINQMFKFFIIKKMGGVDRFDQYCLAYPYGRRSRKWYQTVWHFIIEVLLVNGCIAYNMYYQSHVCSNIEVREKIDWLISDYKKLSTQNRRGQKISIASNERLVGRHFPVQFEDKTHKPNSVVCRLYPPPVKRKEKVHSKGSKQRFIALIVETTLPFVCDTLLQNIHTCLLYTSRCV